MRLGEMLSKPPAADYVQVEGFLAGRRGSTGQKAPLSVGKVLLNFYCKSCDDTRTFTSQGDLACVFVDKQVVSIDCVLECGCGAGVQVWFLVECETDIRGHFPKIRVMRRSERLSECVVKSNDQYGRYSVLVDKAQHAYGEGLGAGSIVYLRKAFEGVTKETADAMELDYATYPDGNPKNFQNLLKLVDKEHNIVPREFSENGYRLFRELSDVVHGNGDEELALSKYEPLKRLVLGILDNVHNRQELQQAMESLGWK